MELRHLLTISLSLFDGGTAAGGGGAVGPGATPGQGGGRQTLPSVTPQGGDSTAAQPPHSGDGKTSEGKKPAGKRRGSGEFQNVRFGKQDSPTAGQEPGGEKSSPEQPSDAGKEQERPETLEERRRRFRELMSGEFKDLYTEETQRIIDRRFRQAKLLEERMGRSQGILDTLMERYQIPDGDLESLARAVEEDKAYLTKAAQEANLSVEQYKLFRQLKQQNAQLLQRQRTQQAREFADRKTQQWAREGWETGKVYPDFDLMAEMRNPQFASLLRSGIPVRHAYEVIHMEDIKAGVARRTAQATEKKVVDAIRAKGARPPENGTSAQSAFTVKDDVSKLTRKERAEIARRVQLGDTGIRF